MNKIGLLLFALFCFSSLSCASPNKGVNTFNNNTPLVKSQVRGSPVYIQIFKEEGILELYVKPRNQFQLLRTYPICKYSGGLGPKQIQGDLKSPEGFYRAASGALNPNSRFYKSINLGFPNAYDLANGYTGNYLLIHGQCKSTGCYAMTNESIEEIYDLVQAAFLRGQGAVAINIFPFRMSEQNMQRHRNSSHINFWRQLKPGYDYFAQYRLPPDVRVANRQYVVQRTLPWKQASASEYAFTKAE